MKNLKPILSVLLTVAIVLTIGCNGGQQLPKGAESLSADQFSKAELESGMKIFSCPDTKAPVTAVVVRVNIGSINENPGQEGYAAVLSRLLTADGEERAARQINSLGSTLKVKHEPEALVLSATVLKEDAVETAQLLLNILRKEYSEQEVIAARDALVSNFKRLDQSEDYKVQQLLSKTLYPESARGAESATRVESLSNLTVDSFNSFLEKNVIPQNTSFALAGDVSAELLSNFSNDAADWVASSVTVPAEEKAEEEAEQDGEKYTPIFVKNVKSSFSRLFMLRRLPPLNSATYYETLAINRILNGKSTFSRLSALQATMKINNPIFSAIELNKKESAQIITATVPAKETYKALSEVMKQMQVLYGGKLLNSRLLGQEVSDARNFLKGQLIRRTEELDQMGEFVLWAEDAGFEKHLPTEHLAFIDGINKENLLVVIDSYFVPALNSLVVVGPTSMVSQFEKNFKVEIVD